MSPENAAAKAYRDRGIAKFKENIHIGCGVVGVASAIISGILFILAFAKHELASAASQSVGTVVASVALLVAVWSVIITRRISEEIAHSSLQQRRLAANSEINRLWQQLNVDALGGNEDAARADSSPDPNATECDDVRLTLVHIVLGILRQIWLFQTLERVGDDFWETPGRYWSHRIRVSYPKEWEHIISEHKGYDLDFLRQVVAWSTRAQVTKEQLLEIDSTPPLEIPAQHPAS